MIEAQQKGLEDTTVYMVGQQLKDICRSDPACAAIVAEDLQNKEMSIAACEKKIKAYADEIKAKKKVKALWENILLRLWKTISSVVTLGKKLKVPYRVKLLNSSSTALACQLLI